jgi:predicted AAA+ superfamily ATPase
VGNVFSATNISKYLKSQKVNIPVQTVLNYLGALERAYFLRKARRIDVKGLRKFETNEKYYFEDIGLRNLLAKTPEAGDINKVIENAVFNYLVQHDWSVNIGVLEDREIDFAAEKGQAKVYIQAAWRIGDRETAERELKPLEAVGDSFPKYLVTFDEPLPAYTASGIRCIRLGDFLLKDGE